MRYHLVVLTPLPEVGWRAHFPDFPGSHAEGATVEAAIEASSLAVSGQVEDLRSQRLPLPAPQTYDDVRANGWGVARGIDWARAVISLVPVRFIEEDELPHPPVQPITPSVLIE